MSFSHSYDVERIGCKPRVMALIRERREERGWGWVKDEKGVKCNFHVVCEKKEKL